MDNVVYSLRYWLGKDGLIPDAGLITQQDFENSEEYKRAVAKINIPHLRILRNPERYSFIFITDTHRKEIKCPIYTPTDFFRSL